MMYEKMRTYVPFYFEHLNDHKLHVEQSRTNEMIYLPSKNYPKIVGRQLLQQVPYQLSGGAYERAKEV